MFLALESLSKRKHPKKSRPKTEIKLVLSEMKFLPRFAFYCDGELIELSNSAGRISTGMVVPYPPGIPILVPGQLITKEIVDFLMHLYEKGVEMHGMKDGIISVATKKEETYMEQKGHKIG